MVERAGPAPGEPGSFEVEDLDLSGERRRSGSGDAGGPDDRSEAPYEALDLDRVDDTHSPEAERFLERVAYTNAHAKKISTPTRSERLWDLAVGAGLLVLAAVIPLFRQSGTPSWNTVWAEDGSIYAQQAIRQGSLNVVLRGYAGYLQLPPRLLAIVTPWFSIRQLALYCSVMGVIVSALLAWFVYRMAGGWISSPIARLVLASFMVLTPALGPENTANVVNLIWVFLAAAPWALIAVEEGRGDTALRSAVVFLAATASPLCVLYVPMAIVWVLIRRTRSAMVVAGSMFVGLALQGVVILTTNDQSRFVIRQEKILRDAIGQRVFATFLLGPKWASSLWLHHWKLSAIGSTLVVLALVIALLPRSGRPAQVLALAFVGYAVAMFVVPVWGRGTFVLGLTEGGSSANASARLAVVPVILLAGALALLIGPKGVRRRKWVEHIVLPVFVAQVALLTIVNFSVHQLPLPRQGHGSTRWRRSTPPSASAGLRASSSRFPTTSGTRADLRRATSRSRFPAATWLHDLRADGGDD